MHSIEFLRSSLERSFPLRMLKINIGTLALSIATASDIDSLIERISEEEFRKDERLPYWAEIWHSAIALSQFLQHNPTFVAGKNVLEIGCGLGVTGITATTLGAHVTFSDYDQHALIAAELNFHSNINNGVSEFVNLDFRRPPDQRWPVILAADIVYEKRYIKPLADFFSQCLEEKGLLLLAEPNRMIAIPFFKALTERGFGYLRFDETADLYARPVAVGIYAISRTLLTRDLFQTS